jgi:hypothetical protein
VGFTEYYSGGQVKEDEGCGACSTHESDEKCTQNFNRKPEVKVHLGGLLVDMKIMWRKDVDWIQPAQDGIQWWAVVSTIMSLWIT